VLVKIVKKYQQKQSGEPREILADIKHLDDVSAEILKLIQGLL
jgi:hypothetical protein